MENEPGAQELRAARFSDRFVAYLIDVVPFAAGLVGTVYVVFIPLAKPPTPETVALIGAAWITALFGYQLIGNMTGATLGKRLIGLRLIRRDGTPVGFGRALVRAVVWMLGTPVVSFGFVAALFNKENRALHDLASGTVVVEAYRKSAAEGAALFLAAAIGAAGLFGWQIYSGWAQPTPNDLKAVAKARQGLDVIALVQEAYKEKHGVYASSIEQLAEVSGDPAEFRAAMTALFMPEPFTMEAGNRGWRIRAVARDRHKTKIVRDGP